MNIMNHETKNEIYTYAPLKECLHFIVIPHSLFKKWQDLEYSGFLRIRTSFFLWSAKPPSLKLSSLFFLRSITYHLHIDTHSNEAVSVTSVILGVRTQLAEKGPALTTEFCLSFLVGHALVFLRTQILHEPVFSHSGYQIPHSDFIYEHPMGCLPTHRAVSEILKSSEERMRQALQKVWPHLKETGSIKIPWQMKQVSVSWGVCKMSDSIFLRGEK